MSQILKQKKANYLNNNNQKNVEKMQGMLYVAVYKAFKTCLKHDELS